MTRIAIIGAGLAGLTLANRLKDIAQVEVFEKARGAGGRMATRYADPYQFDHGAQYFTVRDERFENFLKPLIESGVVAVWPPRFVTLEEGRAPEPLDPGHERYVATPRMNALCKHLADGINVRIRSRIEAITREKAGWQIINDIGQPLGLFDWVIVTTPAPQAVSLLPQDFTGWKQVADVSMSGNFTLMAGFREHLAIDWDGAKTRNSPVGWIAVNSAKPGRETGTSLVIQSTNDWAEENLEEDRDKVQSVLMDAAERLIGQKLPKPDHAAIHRWRYAATPGPLGQSFLADEDASLGVCGDWCLKGKVESAFLSATEMADYLAERV